MSPSSLTPPTERAAAHGDYELFCYCEATRSAPQHVVRLDDNQALLSACRGSGRTKTELRQEGFSVTESQLQLLEDWRLVSVDRETKVIRTLVPLLDARQTAALRASMKDVATEMREPVGGKVLEIKEELKKRGYERSEFAVIFAYVLDDLVWRRFEDTGGLTKREVSVDRPHWEGVLWGSAPPRSFACGTNSLSEDGVTLKLNWSPAARPMLRPFLNSWGRVIELFEAYVEHGRVEDPGLREHFAAFGILDSEGELTAPIIMEDEADPLYRSCRELASLVAEHTVGRLDLGRIKEGIGASTEEEALVIAYHELMWELLDIVETEGLVRKPVVLVDPGKAVPADVGQLLLLLRPPPGQQREWEPR